MTPLVLDRLVELEQRHIKKGPHLSFQDGACALEWAAYIAGEPHTDAPQCVCPVLRAFVVSWNDALPSDEERDRLLRAVIPRLVDTKSTAAVEETRSYLALDWLIRVQTPAWLDLRADLQSHAATLRGLSTIQDMASATAAGPSGDAARAAAWDAAWAAAWDAARAAAGDAARAAAGDAAWDAARAAAWDAAWDAARAAAWAAAWDAAGDAAGDAAWAAAWDAARAAARAAAWDAARDAARDAAWDAARDAAGDALKPIVAQLQRSAHDLIDRMIAISEQASYESRKAL